MFYVYDFGAYPAHFRWDYDRFFYERWCRESYEALMSHSDRTEDPERADFFVISATLRCVSFAGVDRAAIWEESSVLPYRETGKKHVVFDLTDLPEPIFDDPGLIVCKSAFHEVFYDEDRHVSIPQFPRYRFGQAYLPASERAYLAGFKGNPRPRYSDLRTRLIALGDDRSMIIKGGEFMPDDLHISAEGVVTEQAKPGEWSYSDMLFQSKFALLPRACGFALSYRMIECMNAGCVPVIISDGYVLPFHDVLDYGRFAISVPENQIDGLRDILEARLGDVDALQAEAHQAYLTYFSSTEKIIRHTMDLVAKRAASPIVDASSC